MIYTGMCRTVRRSVWQIIDADVSLYVTLWLHRADAGRAEVCARWLDVLRSRAGRGSSRVRTVFSREFFLWTVFVFPLSSLLGKATWGVQRVPALFEYSKHFQNFQTFSASKPHVRRRGGLWGRVGLRDLVAPSSRCKARRGVACLLFQFAVQQARQVSIVSK